MDENRPLQYLEQYTSKATIKSYKSSLRNFFESLYGERKPLEGLAKRYVDEERDHEKDVQRFFISMKGRAPKTVRRNLSAIRTFLMENGVELPQLFWRRLRSRIQGSRAQTIDAVPSNADLKQIMMYLPLHGRALYLTLLSSGMRIGEALQLRDEDADFDKVPVQVNIKGEYTKSGNPRVAFISDEAKEILNEWLPRREEYLVVAAAKSRLHEKPVNDPRLFPFGDVNARHIWNNALAKSGHGERDGTTGIRKTHPHTLRKFFRSQLGTVIPVDVVEALMGHEGYLTEVYRKYSQKQLGQFYLKGEHVLHVFTGSTEVNEIRREVKERNEQLQSLVNGLLEDNQRMRSRLEKTEKQVEEQKKTIEFVSHSLADATKWINDEFLSRVLVYDLSEGEGGRPKIGGFKVVGREEKARIVAERRKELRAVIEKEGMEGVPKYLAALRKKRDLAGKSS